MRCCDNCHPDLFPVETIHLSGGSQLKTGRRRHAKTAEEVVNNVQAMLRLLRETLVQRDFPNQYFITGKAIMSDLIVDALAKYARDITSVVALQQTVRWNWAPQYAQDVVTAIAELLLEYLDPELQAREEREREQAFAALQALAAADLKKKLMLVFDTCYEAVLSQQRPEYPGSERMVKTCQIFLRLPQKSVHGDLLLCYPAY
jgi:hypothetical protein